MTLAPTRGLLRAPAELFGQVVARLRAAVGSGPTSRAGIASDGKVKASGMGSVALVGAGPGAVDLLTLRARDRIAAAEVLLHDALVAPEIVALAPPEALVISVGKRKGCHSVPQDGIVALLLAHAKAGRRVVRLKGGDPLVFGRAGEELDALAAEGVPVEIVPGVTAALAAAASAHVTPTRRGMASALVFAAGHDQHGNLPEALLEAARAGSTVAIYMGRTVGATIAGELVERGISPGTPVVAIENASLATERRFAGSLDELADFARRDDIKGPVMLLIGAAVAEGATAPAERMVEKVLV